MRTNAKRGTRVHIQVEFGKIIGELSRRLENALAGGVFEANEADGGHSIIAMHARVELPTRVVSVCRRRPMFVLQQS